MTLDDVIPPSTESHEAPQPAAPAGQAGSCIVLWGAMGSGKSSVGWYLAKSLGLGFLDLDDAIERKEKKPVATIFAEKGEEHFRAVEAAAVQRLKQLRSHVVAVGGGTVEGEKNAALLDSLGITIWLNPPPAELARRLLADPAEVKKRPLLADVLDEATQPERLKILTERLSTLVGNRLGAYKRAKVVINDAFSTPELAARLIRDLLQKDGLLPAGNPRSSFDRWQIM